MDSLLPNPLPQLSFAEQHHALVMYLLAKFAVADWHGVRDVAVDIEKLEAEEAVRQELQGR